MSLDRPPPSSYGVHSSIILWSRALRDHKRLEENYQAWLTSRDKLRRSLIAEIDKVQSSDSGKLRSAKTLARLEAQLERMTVEDNESANPEILKDYPHSITCRRPAYRRLAFENALAASAARINKAEETKNLALSRSDGQTGSQSVPQETAQHQESPTDEEHESEHQEENVEGEGDRGHGEEKIHDPATQQPPAATGAERRSKPLTQPMFKMGLQLDSLLGKLNSGANMTRKVSLNRPRRPDILVSDKWQSKWGLHDVRASKYQYQAPDQKPA